MGSFALVHKFMVHLWFVSWMCISVCYYAQLDYDSSSCPSNETLPGSRYTCNSTHDSCRTFLVYRANKSFQTISEVSALFHMNPDEVLQLNNLTSSSQVLKEGKEILLPIKCACSGQFYQAKINYKVPYNTTFSEVSCGVFEGLLKPLTLAEENPPKGNKLEAGVELVVPLRCACPFDNFTRSMKVKYLVTYPVIEKDESNILSKKFGISEEDFYAVNHIGRWSTLFPYTIVLIPIRDDPIRILDVADSPSLPPGFLPTIPVVETQETTQASNLYIAGPIIGFGLFIALLASGLYVKSLKNCRSDVVPTFNHTNSPTLFSPMRSSPISTKTGRSSTASWLTPDLLAGIKYCLVNYSIEEIEKATKNFSEENKIGDLVYKGLVHNLEEVMIKRMRFEDTRQVIDLHSKINHFNIVELLGVCYGETNVPSWSYLVFELPKNGCLRECLSDPCNALNWFRRTRIAFDIATCLYYLHCCAFPYYAHMNVSSRNIFITSKWRGKLADVGKALATTTNFTPQKTNDSTQSPKGWLAPEYLMHGTVSEKVDIFAFGVVLLELISGRDNFDGKSVKDSLGFLLGEASEGGCFEGLRSFMDPNLNDYDVPEALCLSFLAKDCVADDPMHRPTMDDIMKVLSKMV